MRLSLNGVKGDENLDNWRGTITHKIQKTSFKEKKYGSLKIKFKNRILKYGRSYKIKEEALKGIGC